MTVINVQNDFTQGEITRKLFSRFDIELYKKAAAKLRNVVIEPTGGARRRFGLQFIDFFESNQDQYKLHYFDFTANERFLLLFTDQLLTIYLDDIELDTLVTPYLANEVADISIAQSFNLLVIAHLNHHPNQLIKEGGSFSLSEIQFKNLPGHDFKKNYNDVEFDFDPNGEVGGGRFLNSNSPIFTEDNVGAYFIALGETSSTKNGFARITMYVNPERVEVSITSAFNDAYKTPDKLKGFDSLLTEIAWSEDRGYPQSVGFYEGRLIFGGSRSLPETLFMSVVNDYTDFDTGVGNDADAIQVTVQTDAINSIKYVLGDKSLQLFTDSNVFSSPQLNEQPLTPSNISLRKQSAKGIANVPPRVLDDSTLFVVEGGKKVESFRYQESTAAYASSSISLLASDLINNPIDSDVRTSSPDDQSDYYFLVNGKDGSLAILQSVENQNVIAWTLCTTQGKFKRVTHVGSDIYFIIEREINGSIVNYIEKLDFTLFTDSSKTQVFEEPTIIVGGLEHLIGEIVNVIGDGFVLLDRTVQEPGVIQIERPSNVITVGLKFIIPDYPNKHILIELLPFNVETEAGPTAYIRKRINRIFVDYFESRAILINDIVIPHNSFGPNALNQPNESVSGLWEEPIINNWDPRQTIMISQESPSPCTILGIGYDVTI